MVDVINPGITAGIGQQSQIDPLGMLGRFAQTQNALLQGQLYKAKQAAGQLYTQSLGPDGQPDIAKYGVMLKSHPETSMYAEEAMNQAITSKNLSAELLQKQLVNKQTQADGLSSIYAAASVDPKVNSVGDFVREGYGSQMRQLGIPDDELIAHLANPSPGSPASLQGDQLRSWYKMHAGALRHATDAAGSLISNYDPHGGGQNADGTWNGAYRSPMGATTIPSTGQTYTPGVGFSQQGAVPQVGGASTALSAGPAQGAAALTTQPAAPVAAPTAPTPSVQGATFREQGPQQHWINETYYPDLQVAGERSQNLLNTLNTGMKWLEDVKAGRAAPARLEVARWAKAMGASDDVVNSISPGDINNAQGLQNLMIRIGTQGMATANAGNAAVRSVQEWAQFLRANANLSNDPDAIKKMWDFTAYQAKLVTTQQKQFNAWQRAGKDTTLFPAAWNDYQSAKTQRYLQKYGAPSGQ